MKFQMAKEFLLYKMVQNILESLKMELFFLEKSNMWVEMYMMVKLKVSWQMVKEFYN